jgi:hypothetical protein
MPDFIHLFNKMKDTGMKEPMGVGKNACPEHAAKITLYRSIFFHRIFEHGSSTPILIISAPWQENKVRF